MRRAVTALLVLSALSASASSEDDALVASLEAALNEGRLAEAVALGEAAVKADEKNAKAHHLLGKAYGLSAKRSFLTSRFGLARKCRAEFERAVALDPDDRSARLDLVRYYMKAPHFLGGGREKAERLAQESAKRSAAEEASVRALIQELTPSVAAKKREKPVEPAAPSTQTASDAAPETP